MFLLNADDMGGYLQGPEESDAVLQQLGPFNGVWGHPAAFGGQGGWVYILESAGGGSLAAYGSTVGSHGEPQLVPEGQSAESFGYASGSPTVTSDGTTAGSAVVWVIYEGEQGKRCPAARLRRDPRRGNAAAAVVGLDRHRLEVLGPDGLGRSRLRRHPQRQAGGLRQLLPRPPAGRPGRTRHGRRRSRPHRPSVARRHPLAAAHGADHRHRRGTADGAGGTRPRGGQARPDRGSEEDPAPASPRSAPACWRSHSLPVGTASPAARAWA